MFLLALSSVSQVHTKKTSRTHGDEKCKWHPNHLENGLKHFPPCFQFAEKNHQGIGAECNIRACWKNRKRFHSNETEKWTGSLSYRTPGGGFFFKKGDCDMDFCARFTQLNISFGEGNAQLWAATISAPFFSACSQPVKRQTFPADLGRWVSLSQSAVIDGSALLTLTRYSS